MDENGDLSDETDEIQIDLDNFSGDISTIEISDFEIDIEDLDLDNLDLGLDQVMDESLSETKQDKSNSTDPPEIESLAEDDEKTTDSSIQIEIISRD